MQHARELTVDIRTVKVPRDGSKVEISFLRPNGNAVEEVKFPCTDEPSEAFRQAMHDLDGDFRYLMGLTKKNQAEVHGIHFREKGGRRTFQLLGGLRVDAGYSSLNTPVLYEPGSDLFEDANITDAQFQRFVKVAAEAKKYVEGKRTERLADEPEAEEAEAATT